MKICVISRPPLKELTTKFRITRHHILERIRLMGDEIGDLIIQPIRISNLYLAYGIGIILTPFRFRKMKADIVLADDIESGIAAVLIKILYGIPFVFNFLDDYSLIASYEGRRLRYHILKYFEKTIPKFADLVITVDLNKRDFCIKIGIPSKKLMVIPNGVDTSFYKPEARDEGMKDTLGLNDDKIVLFVGKMNKYYKLDTIVKGIPTVLSEYPDTQFVFVGDGDDINHLKSLAGYLGINTSVIFTGFRPPEEMPKIINLSDICVFSLPDGSALALFEYMACAKPVVLPIACTEKMGISREMFPEDCIVQVENSPSGFAHGIISLLKNDKRVEEIGSRARELTVKRYDWNNLAKEFQKSYEQTLR